MCSSKKKVTFDDEPLCPEVTERGEPVSRPSNPAGHGGSQGAMLDTEYGCLSTSLPSCTNILSQWELDCFGCGVQFFGREDYLHLSLDLVHRGSVSQCLDSYLKGGPLDFECQCGAKKMKEELSFLNLPNVLIIQLKRFTFTPSFTVEKKNRAIVLIQQLVISQDSTFSEEDSLVSVISHLGSSAYSGHQITERDDVTDSWLT